MIVFKKAISRLTTLASGAACAIVLMSPPKAAADFFYHFDNFFSGVSPANPAPWISALFHDVSPGTVELTITAPGLASGEFMSEFYLNLNPAYLPTDLSFTKLSSFGVFTDPVIQEGIDSFKADGDGKYDVHFGFGTSAGARFEAGESIKYQITGVAGLVAMDFNYFSLPAGGHGPFLAAAHVQGIGGDSGWVSPTVLTPVPEPGSAALLGLALGVLGAGRWYFRRSKKA